MPNSTEVIEKYWHVERQPDDSYLVQNVQVDSCPVAAEVYFLLERLIEHVESCETVLPEPENSYEDGLILPGSMVVGANFYDWQSIKLEPLEDEGRV
jgi:hypothetical protein